MSTVNQEMMASWTASGGAISAAATLDLVENSESEVQAAGGSRPYILCIDAELSAAMASIPPRC